MSNTGGYLKAIWQDAFGRTWDDFADQYGKLWLLAYYAVVGLLVYVWLGAITDVPGELANWAQALLAVGAATVGLVFFRLLIAPYRIWKRDQETIALLGAAMADRRKFSEIARDAEAVVQEAITELMHSNYPQAFDWSEWQDKAIAVASRAGDEERSMFQSLVVVAPAEERVHFHRLLAQQLTKLRMIMARAYAKAEGRAATKDEA